MQEKTPQDYANELLKMYRDNANLLEAVEKPRSIGAFSKEVVTPQFEDGTGGLQVAVTTLGRIYPVSNARITVFTGEGKNKMTVETGVTDQSGKSGVFNLKTPLSAVSQQYTNDGETPFARYNVSVQSDGYVEQIAMNVPVFSGVLSVQGIDLLPITAAGKNVAPQIIDEGNNYNL